MKIGYVLKRFPRLSETFVLNELLELERQGVEIEIFSLLKPPAEGRHDLLGDLKANVTYLPGAAAAMGLKMLSGLEAERSTLGVVAEAADKELIHDPLFAAKSVEEATTLHIKAATVALLAQMHGLTHLHAHFGSDATTVALLAGRMARIGFSYTAHARDIYHTYLTPEADNAMRRAKIAEASFIATVSDYNRAHLGALAPEHAGRIHRVYNGVDMGQLAPPAASRRAGEILAVGRMIEKKGFGDLIDACAILKADGVEFNCRIVGEGPLREALQGRIDEAGLSDQVALVGAMTQGDVFAAMKRASVLAAPFVIADSGDRDGLPTVLLEAMALGLPCVSTPVTGVPEIIADGVTGLTPPANDPAAFAAALRAVLEAPERAAAMGAAARRRAEQRFDLAANVGQLRRLIEASSVDYGAARKAAQ